MSHNPWPYVVVMLGSLGFLANTMAQQSNRFSNQTLENRTNAPQRGDRAWRSGGVNESTVRVRTGTDPARNTPTLGLSEPSFDNSGSDVSGADNLSFDEFAAGISGRRSATFRRNTDEEVAQIPIQPRTNSLTPEPAPYSPSVGAGRGDYPTNQGRQRGSRFNTNPRRVNGATITQENIDDARLDGTRYTTRESSLFDPTRKPGSLEPRINAQQEVLAKDKNGDAMLSPFGPNRSVASTNAKKPTLSSEIASVFGGNDKVGSTNTDGTTNVVGRTPTWFKWALLFSVGANIFFGYIAMNMHSRYQDLIEDMHASESRLERQRPRRRVHDRDEEPVSSRVRRRDADEAAFLQGGIEV